MKLNFYISIHKLLSAPVILVLIALFYQWDNPTAWVYLGLHGSYGILWALKSKYFPDKHWEARTSMAYGVLVGWGSLTTYWVAPWLLCLRGVHAPMYLISLLIVTFTLGVFFHFTADMQKTISLKLNPEHLVMDGVWSLCRNPNYFGELLIYLSLALLSMHWLPVGILALWIGVYWLPNMRKKDRSLARYPEFTAYQARTRLFIPFIY